MRRTRRATAVVMTAIAALALSACGGAPTQTSVIAGSSVDVAWPGSLTTLNAQTASGVAPGDHDVAGLTRSQFARSASGEVTTDPSFGSVEIRSESDDALTVRYDLAEPVWSDGIAVDAADLILAWAAGSGRDAAPDDGGFDGAPTGLAHSTQPPSYDEFERRIDVTFDRPVADWQTALNVAVPAHVAGQIAFGLEDPMVAKQAVIDAVLGDDTADLTKLAAVWNGAFDVSSGQPPSERLTLSNGPYRVDGVEGSAKDGTQRVSLVANTEYAGATPVSYEQIVLQQDSGENTIARVGSDFGIVQLPVSDVDFTRVRDLERDDFGVTTVSSGRMWALLARVDSWPLDDKDARSAFLRTVPGDQMVAAATGPWKTAYMATSAAAFTPDMDGYKIALEDAGFASTFEPPEDPAKLRADAGVPDNTTVCILYDTDSRFASSAFAALREGIAEAGWVARDCGNPEPEEVVEVGGAYDAILTTVDVPKTPADIARQWGDGAANLTHATSATRDGLVDELSRATDPYDARDIRVKIEKTIVDQQVIIPLAMDPVVLVTGRDVAPVSPAPGRDGALASDPLTWAPVNESPAP